MTMMLGAISMALLSVGLLAVNGQVIDTEYGPVRGQTIQVHLDDSSVLVTSFWGIPYAAPPVGDLRFEPPRKAEPWNGEFVADTLPDLCMQNPAGLLFLTHPFWTKYSENCLTLNIVKPLVATGNLPVLVWFHGGGYTGGGSIQYPGHFLAARDTVVVTVNYRLGVFGFAATPDKVIPGNMGMLDQVLALEFVRDNIANFGGNPFRVTIFGQSAGASSSALHMVSPRSRGLYYQAILESGAENNAWSVNSIDQKPENYIYQVADNLNCTTASTAEMLTCLRAADARDLRVADSIECTPGYFCQGFAPIVDGPGGFLPDNPLTLRENLGQDTVPILAGHCKDDGSLYTLAFIPESANGGFTRLEFLELLRTRLVDIFSESFNNTEHVENIYQAMDFFYAPWPYIDDQELNRQAFNKLITDAGFGYAWDRNAKLNSAYRNTYTYIQSFRSLNASSLIPEWMGVPHNGELPYVWGYGYLLTNPEVRNDSGIYFDAIGWTPEDRPYADYVQTLWTNFAKYGDPTPTPVKSPFNNTLTTWPKFTPNDNLKVLDLDGEIRILENYRQKDYAFWTKYLSYAAKRPVKKEGNANEQPRKKVQLSSAQFQEQITRLVLEAVSSQYPGDFDEAMKIFKMEHF